MKNKHKKGNLFGMLAVLLLVQAAAQATYLPGITNAYKKGSHIYDEGSVYANVVFAVYDTQSDSYNNEFFGVGNGRFKYAYEVQNLNDVPLTITAFKLIGFNGNPNPNPAVANGSIGMQRNGTNQDIEPTSNQLSFEWNFDNSLFVFNKYSAFMVFSSNEGPTRGDVKLTASGDDMQVPTPEPATLAMLAAGAVGLMRKRKARNS